MKVTLSIKKPKIVNYTVKGKDYTDAAEYLLGKPFAACTRPIPIMTMTTTATR